MSGARNFCPAIRHSSSRAIRVWINSRHPTSFASSMNWRALPGITLPRSQPWPDLPGRQKCLWPFSIASTFLRASVGAISGSSVGFQMVRLSPPVTQSQASIGSTRPWVSIAHRASPALFPRHWRDSLCVSTRTEAVGTLREAPGHRSALRSYSRGAGRLLHARLAGNAACPAAPGWDTDGARCPARYGRRVLPDTRRTPGSPEGKQTRREPDTRSDGATEALAAPAPPDASARSWRDDTDDE